MSTRLGRQAGVALTLAALVGGEAVLWRAGRRLPSLPLDPDRLGATVAETDPLTLVVGVLRLGALSLGAGLIAVTVAGLVSRGLGAARLVARVDRWTPPGLRHLLDGALGIGLAATIGLSTPASAGPNGPSPPGAVAVTAAAPSETPAPSLRRLPDGPAPPPDPTTTAPPVQGAAPPPTGPSPTPGPASEPAATREVVVRPGDSFWRLAERHQAERLGRQPTEGEVVACWVDLVARNRHRLLVRDDPDLIFPGQVFQIPCP